MQGEWRSIPRTLTPGETVELLLARVGLLGLLGLLLLGLGVGALSERNRAQHEAEADGGDDKCFHCGGFSLRMIETMRSSFKAMGF